MGKLTERAADLSRRANLAEKNIPKYARMMPGVGESVAITRELLELVQEIAAHVEGAQS